MYPLKLNKIFIPKIWGGKNLEKILNINIPNQMLIGESWEVSSYKNKISIILNGKLRGFSLQEVIDIFQEEFLGKKVYKKYKNKFPLLIKFLDINDKLSIQVHPNDEYALKNHNDFGKKEVWYVISASKHAKIYLGLNPNVTKEKFKDYIKNKNFKNVFNEIPVKKGDFINIVPGMVHGTCKGNILICEIQQNSDLTYRIYDFDRKIDGKLRELHLDKALDVINCGELPKIINLEKKCLLEKISLLKSEIFNVDKLNINGKFKDEINESFKIYSIVNGSGKLKYGKNSCLVKKGETILVPSKLNISFSGKLEILKSYL